jgi:pimeloyl-ACP methyl ester carboxylesterase
MMARSVSRTERGRTMMIKMLSPLTKADIARQMDAAYGGFLQENLDVSFGFPVLILVGEYDRTGKVSAYCEAWAKRTGFPLSIVPGAAHLSNVDNPDDVNDKIGSFLKNTSFERKSIP